MVNAGENQAVAVMAKSRGIDIETVAPNTPQQNGAIERAFAYLTGRGRAMMLDAGIMEAMKDRLWEEVFNITTLLDNVVHHGKQHKCPFELFFYKRNHQSACRSGTIVLERC
jgi:hypothetical protein